MTLGVWLSDIEGTEGQHGREVGPGLVIASSFRNVKYLVDYRCNLFAVD
jgi:hypothetical protein